MKVIRVGAATDIDRAAEYGEVADWLMFDALPPKDMKNALPGGNALSFDWALLAGRDWPLPWMLAGGLTVDNVGEAVRLSGAQTVDTSSGVEDAPGRKNPDKIRAFLDGGRRPLESHQYGPRLRIFAYGLAAGSALLPECRRFIRIDPLPETQCRSPIHTAPAPTKGAISA